MDRTGTHIEVAQEREVARGWEHDVLITTADEQRSHTVRLDWADHDHWTGGTCSPSRTTEILIALLVEHAEDLPGELPEKFDASTARRWLDELDSAIQMRL